MTTIQIKVPNWLDKIFTWPVVAYRQWKYGYTYRRIYLGEDEWTIVEPADYYRLGNIKWCLGGHRTKLYAIGGVRNENGKGIEIVYLHREVMNAPKGRIVDHKNGNSLDNRRANLRLATRSQNCQNSQKRKNTSSRFIGVSFHKLHKKWWAYINFERKRIPLGYFDNEIDAARAYDAAARKYYGEFAKVNCPAEQKAVHRG